MQGRVLNPKIKNGNKIACPTCNIEINLRPGQICPNCGTSITRVYKKRNGNSVPNKITFRRASLIR